MKTLFYKILLLGLTILGPLCLYNYFTDFYGVFNQELDGRLNEPNFRFIKTKYVINNPDKYDSYVFGSSRAGKILAHRHNEKAYNMYSSEGIPAEFLEDIRVMIENQVTIKHVYIALDEFSFKIIPKKHQGQLLRMRYHNDLLEDISSYIQYLIDPPKIEVPKFEIATNFDYSESGSPLHFKVDSLIEQDVEKHVSAQKFKRPKKYYNDRVDETIDELKEIIKLCQSNQIEITFLFNPTFVNTYTQYTFENIAEIKSKLAKITDYEDFSGFNHVTQNPINYYESNHYRYHVGDSIWLHCINAKPASFAKHITKNNVEEHLENEEKEWEMFLGEHQQ